MHVRPIKKWVHQRSKLFIPSSGFSKCKFWWWWWCPNRIQIQTNTQNQTKHKHIQSTTEIEKSTGQGKTHPLLAAGGSRWWKLHRSLLGGGRSQGEEGGYCKVCPLPTHIHVEDDDQTKAKTQIHTETGWGEACYCPPTSMRMMTIILVMVMWMIVASSWLIDWINHPIAVILLQKY